MPDRKHYQGIGLACLCPIFQRIEHVPEARTASPGPRFGRLDLQPIGRPRIIKRSLFVNRFARLSACSDLVGYAFTGGYQSRIESVIKLLGNTFPDAI